MKLTGENRSTRGETCPSATLSTTNPTWTDPGSNPGLRGERSATNRLSYGTAVSLGNGSANWCEQLQHTPCICCCKDDFRIHKVEQKFKIVHVPCSKMSHHTHTLYDTHTHTHTHTYIYIYTNSCTIIRYSDIQTCGNPPTCFDLFRPSSERYSTKKNMLMASYIIDVQ
jgi:hypothetical protein